jgi:hypothetical protein
MASRPVFIFVISWMAPWVTACTVEALHWNELFLIYIAICLPRKPTKFPQLDLAIRPQLLRRVMIEHHVFN